MAEPPGPVRTAAVIGCGVIGSGWVARMRLRGVDVRVYDPAPDAVTALADVQAAAVASWSELSLPVDSLGALVMADSVEDAVLGVDLVQENVPERLDLKHATLTEIGRVVEESAVVASSTSGFRPTVLAEVMPRPEQLVVAHPFNPVYLLPLVEVVGGRETADSTIAQALECYRFLGMNPLHVRVEIDAFIADRLLEAMWREALWLVNDGVATTGEIDDAIRYGFGLRFAQMGLFDTYRTAGGRGGMRHFIAQFGEALDWPWTKLTDTPELTDELVDRIASQSDRQSGAYSAHELARLRDRNLVGILRALEANDWGAGSVVAQMRADSIDVES